MDVYSRYILPRLIHLTMRMHTLERFRRPAAAQAHGTVLELGFGSGLNLGFYDPTRVRLIYALEPEPGMLKLAQERIAASAIPVEVLATGAERIPLPAAAVDTVLSTWTLCSIPDIRAALSEVRRVLKPDGLFVFAEHGLAPEPSVARWQHRLTPYWRRCAGGCHLDRSHGDLLREAGFELEHCTTGYLGFPKPMTFMYTGRAVPA